MMPGVQPVNVKPYRHSLQQNNKIECQISDMMMQGVIKTSHRSFASPVGLVKKNDDLWRFCVEY
jgi:hypothetical protein